jgi:hypothetical protein
MNKTSIVVSLVLASVAAGGVALATSYYTEQFDSGDQRGYTGDGDWAVGSYKGQCNAGDAIKGVAATPISMSPDSRAHSVLCQSPYGVSSNSLEPVGNETTHSLTGSDDRADTSTGDWDPGYTKAECAQDEAITGVAQSGDSSLDMTKILCSWIQYEFASGNSGCNTLWFSSIYDNRVDTSTGDWAVGYSKNECGQTQILKGVSADPNTGAIHALLCCPAVPFPH